MPLFITASEESRTVPETRVAGKGEVHRVIFDTMLRRAGISF